MAKNFNSDFYVVCATVIPVLFLAVAVQGGAYKSVLQAAMVAARTKASDGSMRQLRALVVSRALQLIGYWIWCAGAIGEVIALMVLYQGREGSGTRLTVFLCTVMLILAASAGPLGAYLDIRSAIRNQRGTLPDDLPKKESAAPHVYQPNSDDAGPGCGGSELEPSDP